MERLQTRLILRRNFMRNIALFRLRTSLHAVCLFISYYAHLRVWAERYTDQ